MRTQPASGIPWFALVIAGVVHLLPPLLFIFFVKPPGMGEGGDFGAYYYALQEAVRGGNPYDVAGLRAMSPWPVPPYFYPPPFLLCMVWSLLLPYRAAIFGMLVFNVLLWVAILLLMRRHWGVSWKFLAVLTATWFPLWDNLVWGQANLLLLLPAVGAMVLASRRPSAAGFLVGVAAVIKVIPGILALYWVVRRQWRPLAGAAAAALVLTLLSLPLVAPETQLAYYTHYLVGHAQGRLGDFGLRVPINSEYSHSLIAMFSHVWPGPVRAEPSVTAQAAAMTVFAGLLAAWGWWVRRGASAEAALASLLGIASIASTYAWEHHLVLLIPAAVLAARSEVPRWGFVTFYACIVWPLGLVLALIGMVPGVGKQLAFLMPWFPVVKVVGIAGVCWLCLRASVPARAPEASAPTLAVGT